MDVLVVNHSEVRRLLPMDECIDTMADALTALSSGRAEMPLRLVHWLPEGSGALAAMPALLPGANAMSVKVLSIIPGNRGTEFDSHQGAVLLFEIEHGRLLAIIDAGAVTAIRTAAVSAVATRALAREDAADLAILGSGVQAGTHLEAMLQVRPVKRVRVWSRHPENAERFAERASSLGIPVQAASSAQEAVAGADLICTVTSAPEPILQGEWLRPGAHVNAIGAVGPAARELDTAAVLRSRLYVDRRESALNEAGEFLVPKQEGAIGDGHIVGELGEVLLKQVEGRTSADDITLFRGLGLAIEDLAAARLVYRRATGEGAGIRVELGGTAES